MSKLHNVRGRITYISSHAKQENLYAVYETTDRHYWTELARFNQQEFLKSGTEGKCIEARELIIALPESFPDLYDPDRLLQMFTNRFKEKYGVECVSALHHNKRKTNYHIHLIFSERELLPEPIEKIATRNMFYNEQKKHVRTKKEILDDSGNVRKGCKIIKKGEVYERTLFTAKNKLFKQEHYLDEAKRFYTAQRVTDAYQKECSKWEEAHGEKATPKAETMHDKIKRYQEKVDMLNASQPYRSRDKRGEIIALTKKIALSIHLMFKVIITNEKHHATSTCTPPPFL